MRSVLPAGCEANLPHCGSVGASESENLGQLWRGTCAEEYGI